MGRFCCFVGQFRRGGGGFRNLPLPKRITSLSQGGWHLMRERGQNDMATRKAAIISWRQRSKFREKVQNSRVGKKQIDGRTAQPRSDWRGTVTVLWRSSAEFFMRGPSGKHNQHESSVKSSDQRLLTPKGRLIVMLSCWPQTALSWPEWVSRELQSSRPQGNIMIKHVCQPKGNPSRAPLNVISLPRNAWKDCWHFVFTSPVAGRVPQEVIFKGCAQFWLCNYLISLKNVKAQAWLFQGQTFKAAVMTHISLSLFHGSQLFCQRAEKFNSSGRVRAFCRSPFDS